MIFKKFCGMKLCHNVFRTILHVSFLIAKNCCIIWRFTDILNIFRMLRHTFFWFWDGFWSSFRGRGPIQSCSSFRAPVDVFSWEWASNLIRFGSSAFSKELVSINKRSIHYCISRSYVGLWWQRKGKNYGGNWRGKGRSLQIVCISKIICAQAATQPRQRHLTKGATNISQSGCGHWPDVAAATKSVKEAD